MNKKNGNIYKKKMESARKVPIPSSFSFKTHEVLKTYFTSALTRSACSWIASASGPVKRTQAPTDPFRSQACTETAASGFASSTGAMM